MTAKHVKNRKLLKTYKFKIYALFILILSVITVLIFVFSEKILKTISEIKNISQIVQTQINEVKEVLNFENADISLKLEKTDIDYFIFAKIKNNKSDSLELKNKPFVMNKFEAFAEGYLKNQPQDGNWIEKVTVSSNFIDLIENGIKIYDKVFAKIYTKSNPKFNDTTIIADEITFFKNQQITGSGLFGKNKEGIFKAGNFSANSKKTLINFKNKVMIENTDYKITSENLDIFLINKEVQNMIFSKSVFFTDKGFQKTKVRGEKAVYNPQTSEITIYENVVITSEKNNLKIKASSFHYNEKTKVGYFKNTESHQNQTSEKRQIEVELEI